MLTRQNFAGYIRNFVFGVEDSIVSTVGLLSGIAAAGTSRKIILLTGVVLIFVEAFSMAIGSFLSEQSAKEYIEGGNAPLRQSITEGIIMFFSYFVSGFIPIAPYFIFVPKSAILFSIILSLGALFALGAINAKMFLRVNPFMSGVRMLIIGGAAVGIGVIVGVWINK